ncbi:hypothetical protein CDD80_2499 [Ophiocordyceps camponoti-rufipedis]|uniref:Uncharacterized protein n=1 Tax=Ophiocordyceps camponoti-rufipedis TaxID=2004952 RepID=A0A2C5Z6D8_9HYPO|nr:hypothetical protein CDD80_2499 [Ophiocordyceps camponoti-rufipedis]
MEVGNTAASPPPMRDAGPAHASNSDEKTRRIEALAKLLQSQRHSYATAIMTTTLLTVAFNAVMIIDGVLRGWKSALGIPIVSVVLLKIALALSIWRFRFTSFRLTPAQRLEKLEAMGAFRLRFCEWSLLLIKAMVILASFLFGIWFIATQAVRTSYVVVSNDTFEKYFVS